MLSFLKNEDLRIEAYKELGVFITTLAGTNIDKKLIDYYLSMTDMSITSSTKIANEVIHFFLHLLLHYKVAFQCAYTFPGVLQTLGLHYWP